MPLTSLCVCGGGGAWGGVGGVGGKGINLQGLSQSVVWVVLWKFRSQFSSQRSLF